MVIIERMQAAFKYTEISTTLINHCYCPLVRNHLGITAKHFHTINFLNIRTPKEFVAVTLKVEKDGFSLK